MSILWVHDGYQKEFDRKINRYSDKLEEIQKKYTYAMTLSSGYHDSDINSCNIYLKKRKASMDQAISKATEMQKKVHKYVASVVETDRNISKSIHTWSYNMYREKGIGPQKDTMGFRMWNAIVTTAEDFLRDTKKTFTNVVEDIKEFYEANKYVVNIVLDIAVLLAAIALLTTASFGLIGIICAIGSIWAISKATYELVTDTQGLIAYQEGDEKKAEELSQKTLTKTLINFGASLDEKWRTHFMETIVKGLTIGLEICEFTTSIVLVGQKVLKIFELEYLKALNLKYVYKRSFKENLSDLKKIKWFGTKKLGRFGSLKNWLKFASYSVGFSVDSKTSTWESVGQRVENIFNGRNIFEGDFFKVNPLSKKTSKCVDSIVAITMG